MDKFKIEPKPKPKVRIKIKTAFYNQVPVIPKIIVKPMTKQYSLTSHPPPQTRRAWRIY